MPLEGISNFINCSNPSLNKFLLNSPFLSITPFDIRILQIFWQSFKENLFPSNPIFPDISLEFNFIFISTIDAMVVQ